MKRKAKSIVFVLINVWFCGFLIPSVCQGQTAPVIGLHENTPSVVVIKNVRIVVGPGHVLENASLVVRDSNIEAVGTGISEPPDAVVYDLSGKTLYPGFIDLYTHYGISEKKQNTSGVGSLHWNAAVHPECEAVKNFLPDEEEADSLRKNGITAVVTLPQKGLFRGSGALVLLSDTEPNKAILMNNVVQSLSFTANINDYPRSLMGSIALIRQTLYDTRWYTEAWEAYKKAPDGQIAPEINLSLAALKPCAEGHKPLVFETSDLLDIFRVETMADEFDLEVWLLGCGYEYRRVADVKKSGVKLIIPLNFPEPPDVSTDEVTLRDLRHYDFAPENPARLSQADIDFSLTTASMEKADAFIKNVRIAVKRGLPPDKALAALTTIPAQWLGMSHLLGTLEKGKIANFLVTDGDLFEDKTKILDTWIAGKRYEINPVPEIDVRGTWALEFSPGTRIEKMKLEISGDAAKPEVKTKFGEKSVPALQTTLEKRLVMFAFPLDSLGYTGVMRMNGQVEEKTIYGHGVWSDGSEFGWEAVLIEPWKAEPDTAETEPVQMAEFTVVYPEGAFGRTSLPEQPEVLLVKNARLWTCGPKGIIEQGDLLIKKGKIIKVGKDLTAPGGTVILDASGKQITPGLIDAHSHLAIRGGVNEGSHSITSETRISDVIDCDDINIYRQLAGGLTMACISHGSANTIGGQNAVIKLCWGTLTRVMIVDDARPGLKFALGENVKRSNVAGPTTTRYPITRMGVEQFIRDSFQAAKDYRKEWQDYTTDKKRRKNLRPPRRDLRLEPLVEILDGKRQIQCHSYRQDEILAVMRVAEEMGFKVEFFIHILEGYKVADVMRQHGAMPSSFSDWWAYKFEVYDAIPYNGALMHEQGLLVSFNSDNIELARRMNLDAAKAVKYGDIPEEEALKFVTLNPAIQLGLGNRVGSLEEGKDADFVIWSGHPLSTYSICEQTWINGQKYFNRAEDRQLREKAHMERTTLIQKILTGNKDKKDKKS